MFHVNLHVPHRNHIFTIMSGTSRAMQKSIFKCDRTQPIQHTHKLNACARKIKNSGYFRIQIYHVSIDIRHRNHIFTITSGTSRAMQPHIYSNAIQRHQRHTNAGIPCVHFRITVRTHMRIIIQHLQRIWRRSYTHQHTPMRFHTVTIHHASCHTSMKPQQNS